MSGGTVTAIGLNLRNDASATADVVAVLTQGSSVDIIRMSDDDSWYLVSATVDGQVQIGWVNALYIDTDGTTTPGPAPAPGPTPAPQPPPGQRTTAADRLFASKAPTVMSDLMEDFALDEIQAAGILGNLGQECGGFTQMQEQRPIAGRGGYGWFQWTGPRRVAFENWCQQQGLDENSDDANYGYLKFELQSAYKSTVAALKQVDTIEAAVNVFEQTYERAGLPNFPSRYNWARKALSAYQSVA
jgi:hypothetical protein